MTHRTLNLNLNDLKVQSFITSLSDDIQSQLRGGVPLASDGDHCGGGGSGNYSHENCDSGGYATTHHSTYGNC